MAVRTIGGLLLAIRGRTLRDRDVVACSIKSSLRVVDALDCHLARPFRL